MEVNGKPFLKNGVRNLMTWKLVAEELAMLASFIEILASRPKKYILDRSCSESCRSNSNVYPRREINFVLLYSSN